MSEASEPFFPPEIVEAAIDPEAKPGVIKIDGQPFPLVEFWVEHSNG